MSSFHEYLRSATAAHHRRLDSHPLMTALMREDLTKQCYAAVLRGLGNALAECELAIAVAQITCNSGDHCPPLATEFRLPLLEADLEILGTMPPRAYTTSLTLTSLPDLAGALYVVEGSRLGGQLIARHLRALGDRAWPSMFFEAGGSTSILRWKQYLHWAEKVVSEKQYLQASMIAKQVFELFSIHLDEAAIDSRHCS